MTLGRTYRKWECWKWNEQREQPGRSTVVLHYRCIYYKLVSNWLNLEVFILVISVTFFLF